MDINHQLNESLLHIGQKLSHIRRTRNEKLITVAKAVDMSHGIISRIENGRYNCLSVELLFKLAHYYSISVEELFTNAPGSA